MRYRPRTVAEARTRLIQRGHTAHEVDRTVAQARSEGLLDDRAFTKLWIEDCLQSRPLSRRAVRVELSDLGVEAELIAVLLDDLYPPERETPLALELARQRTGRLSGVDADRRLPRVVSYLTRRGFPRGLAIRVAKAAALEGTDGGTDDA
ncbi:MAG: RecX family transcriptional regulator [Candidatus Bipolaricaulota bacterium]|nr:MAG: RecX family transcriptional regulator [Candidatus Bipolaricaulota bacterium]